VPVTTLSSQQVVRLLERKIADVRGGTRDIDVDHRMIRR